MTHVTCRPTAKNLDQLRNPMLGNRVWATFTFLLPFYGHYTKQHVLNTKGCWWRKVFHVLADGNYCIWIRKGEDAGILLCGLLQHLHTSKYINKTFTFEKFENKTNWWLPRAAHQSTCSVLSTCQWILLQKQRCQTVQISEEHRCRGTLQADCRWTGLLPPGLHSHQQAMQQRQITTPVVARQYDPPMIIITIINRFV